MRLEPRAVASLRPWSGNPRQISDEALAGLGASIGRFGVISPVVVNRRSAALGWPADSVETIVSGHQRVRAMQASGISETDVVVVDVSEAEEKALNVAANSPAISGEFTPGVFALLEEIKSALPDLSSALRMDDLRVDLAKLLRETKPPTEDVVPEPPEIPVTQPGDLLLLGKHRVYCGDSTKAEDVAKAMDGKRASCLWTDPPWNVAYGASSNPRYRNGQDRQIQNDDLGEAFPAFCSSFCERMRDSIVPGGMVYVVMSAQEWPVIDAALRGVGFHWSSTIIWAKDRLVLSRKDYHTQYEPIWYGWDGRQARIAPLEDRLQSDVWQIDRPSRSDEHPTMKPVALVARSIANSTTPGALVADHFLGSGTTLVACEQLGRVCVGLEIDPRYVDVIAQRYETLTGKKAERVRG